MFNALFRVPTVGRWAETKDSTKSHEMSFILYLLVKIPCCCYSRNELAKNPLDEVLDKLTKP